MADVTTPNIFTMPSQGGGDMFGQGGGGFMMGALMGSFIV